MLVLLFIRNVSSIIHKYYVRNVFYFRIIIITKVHKFLTNTSSFFLTLVLLFYPSEMFRNICIYCWKFYKDSGFLFRVTQSFENIFLYLCFWNYLTVSIEKCTHTCASSKWRRVYLHGYCHFIFWCVWYRSWQTIQGMLLFFTFEKKKRDFQLGILFLCIFGHNFLYTYKF